jgi:hypothetical protein
MGIFWKGLCCRRRCGFFALGRQVKISIDRLKKIIQEELFYREFYRKGEEVAKKRDKNEINQTKTKRDH